MINAQEVRDIFKVCLFREEEVKNGKPKPEAIFIEGITAKFGLHKERVNKRKDKILGFLKELPEKFFEGSGGGWSFLNLCNDKDGKLWTGEHRVMQELVCLGMAIGKVKYTMPKETWAALPGGMPYVTVSL